MALFDEQISRKPNNYAWTQEFIDAMWAGFWTPNEFNFRTDKNQFYTELTEQEQGVIVRSLSAIGQIEIAVKTFWANLGSNLRHPSLSDLGFVMSNSEVIHNQAYEKLLTVLGLEDQFDENLKTPEMGGRVQYLKKHLAPFSEDYQRQYIYSIILFTLFVENVSLFSQFYVILHFYKTKSILTDTAQQVLYTKNEETMHSNIGIKIINTLHEEYPELFDDALKARIWEECNDALKYEFKIVSWILGDYEADGLSNEVLQAYLRYRMNDSLTSIGFQTVEDPSTDEVKDKFRWMTELVTASVRSDFFAGRPVEYDKHAQSIGADDLI